MGRFGLAVFAALIVCAAVPSTAQARIWDIKSKSLGALRAVDGKPVCTSGSEGEDQVWSLSPVSKKTRVAVQGKRSLGSLTYPLKGDDTAVTLTHTADVPKWEVTKVKGTESSYTFR